MLQEYKVISRILESKEEEISEIKLYFFRAFLFILSCLAAFLTDDVTIVINLGGALVIPVISFYLPMLLNFMYHKVYKIKRSRFMEFHDYLIVIFGVGVQILSLSYTIKYQL